MYVHDISKMLRMKLSRRLWDRSDQPWGKLRFVCSVLRKTFVLPSNSISSFFLELQVQSYQWGHTQYFYFIWTLCCVFELGGKQAHYEPLSSSSLGVNILALNPNGSGNSVRLEVEAPIALSALLSFAFIDVEVLSIVFMVPAWLMLAWTGSEVSSILSGVLDGESVCVGDIVTTNEVIQVSWHYYNEVEYRVKKRKGLLLCTAASSAILARAVGGALDRLFGEQLVR